MIAVLRWENFDTQVMGIFSSCEKAREYFKDYPREYAMDELRFIKVITNEFVDFDWYKAEPLFPEDKMNYQYDFSLLCH